METVPRDKLLKSTGELVDFLKEHLFIRISEENVQFEGTNRVTIGLYLGEEEIDSDYLDIKTPE